MKFGLWRSANVLFGSPVRIRTTTFNSELYNA